VLVIAAGVATAIGAVLPWITASIGTQSGSLLGTELGQLSSQPILGANTGVAVFVIGVVIAALGLVGAALPRVRVPMGLLGLLAAIAAGVVIATAVPPILTEMDNLSAGSTDISVMLGFGFFVSVLGAAVAAVASIWVAVSSR
jgi:hypothetical protein